MRSALSVGVGWFAPDAEFGLDDEGPDPLVFATERVSALTSALELPCFGYRCERMAPEDGSDGPTADRLGDAVHERIAAPGPDGVLIVHVVSHGALKPTGLYVLGSDSVHTARTSVGGWLSAVEDFPGRPLVLFLLDLCHSGAAARLEWQLRRMLDGSNRAWVMAASAEAEMAVDGRFSKAVAEVLTALAERRLQFDPGSRYISFHWFADEVRKRLGEMTEAQDGLAQRITVSALDGVGPDLPFLPNPGYWTAYAGPAPFPAAPGAFDPVLDEVADPDHFRRHAQGGAGFPVAPAERQGLFTGRAAEVERVALWLAGGTGVSRLMVVTGSPGAGKSALLGVLLCAAQPELREGTRALWEPLGREVTARPTPLPVHARQRTLAEVVRSLVRRTGAHGQEWSRSPEGPETDPRRLIEALSRRMGPPPVVVLDALDEARDPVELVRDLLLPLTTLDRPDGLPLCRMLLGAREEEPCLALISGARTVGDLVDLDAVGHEALEADLRAYVERLLGPERGKHALQFAAATAHALADPEPSPATGPHLIAALYTSYALQNGVAHALEDSETARRLGERVPRDLPGLLDLQFAGDHAHHLLRPVLTTLAFAQGDGLPVGLVAAVARAFDSPRGATEGDGEGTAEIPPQTDAPDAPDGTAEPTDPDPDDVSSPDPDSGTEADPASGPDDQTTEVVRLLDELRAFLRTVPDGRGTVLYRLLHQSIANELRGQAAPGPRTAPGSTAEQAVYAALLGTLRGPGAAEDPRWAGLDDYLRRHLAQHAVDAGCFDALCADPGFLVHADPDRIDPELGHAESESARSAATVYRTSAHVHRRTSDEGRRHILAIDAVRQGARTLADRLARPGPGQGIPMAWPPQWATASRISAAHAFTLPLPEDRVTALAAPATGPSDVVTGTRGGRLRVWDARHGQVRASADPGRGEIRALACTELADRPGVLVVAADGVPEVRALPGLEPLRTAAPLFPGARGVRALVCVDMVGRRMAVTADVDGRLLLWDLLGELPVEELRTRLGRTTALVCMPGEDGPLVAVADDEGTVRFCAPLGEADGPDLRHPCRVTALAAVGDRRCVVTGGKDGHVRLWDAVSHALLATSATAHDGPVYALSHVDDSRDGRQAPGDAEGFGPWVLSGSSDGTIRIWDPARGTEQGRFVGHMGAVTALARPPAEPPVLVSAGLDPALRVWHVPPNRPRTAPAPGHTSWVTALARAELDGRTLLVSAGADGLLHRWDLEQGTPYGTPFATGPADAMAGRPASVHDVAVVGVRERPLVVTAGADGQPRAWDLREGIPYGPAFTPATTPVQALAATFLERRPVLVSAGTDGLLHLWDVETGSRRGLPLAGHVGGVNALACLDVDDQPAVLSCGDDGTLRLWDLATGLPLVPPVQAHQGWATALACTVTDDGVPLAVTGGQDGTVRLWDLSGAQRVRPCGETLPVVGGVNAVACGTGPDGPLVVAADDGAIRVWNPFADGAVASLGVPGAVQSLLVSGDRMVLGCEWEIVVLRRAD
ncbi:AAA family ATPase [Streptomyces sp. NA02950]|uniref:AAA family ATPase n=1 Tax=Streptomyces sp. NA02950 TaxID=2742137 RepID=UPI00159259BD|nr:AAA family ATPase [Streptomyces sp. NA02950]QKV95972.1 AAA family ATPase [Streptomyces sp. NA02950]